MMLGRKQLAVLGAAILVSALLMVACGGGRHNQQAALPLAGSEAATTTPATPQTPATLAEALAQLDALAMPEGVAPEVWDELKGKLRIGLNDRFDGKGAAKIAAKAPTGAENRVWYIYTEEDEEYNIHLKWRYQNVGDYNLDGEVSVADISVLVQEFGFSISEHPEAVNTDGNRDGVVNAGDITALAMHIGNRCTGYRIFGADYEGNQQILTFVQFTSSTLFEGNRVFDLPAGEWDSAGNGIQEYQVRAEGTGVQAGELSYKVSRISTSKWDTTYFAGEDVKFWGSAQSETGSFTFWELPPSITPRISTVKILTIKPPTGSYDITWISSSDGIYADRHINRIKVLGPTDTPMEVRNIALPEGPMLYWGRGEYQDLFINTSIYRDGVLLGEFPRSTWYYYDFHAGTAPHTYNVEMKYKDTLLASSEPFQASGAAYTDEHLYLIAEPQVITEPTTLSVLAVLANNKHPLWVVPSLRTWAQGTSDTPIGHSTSSMLAAFADEPNMGAKGVQSNWPVEVETRGVMPAQPSLGYGWDTQVFYSYPFLTASPNVAALREHNTLLVGPLDFPISPPFEAGAKLMPGTNEEGAFNFYIDNQRNVYSFENVHSLDLQTFEPGPAIASTPISGQLSLGVTATPGDLDGNGIVGMSDITPVAAYFGSTDPAIIAQVDQNGDGEISIIEILYIIAYYGRNYN